MTRLLPLLSVLLSLAGSAAAQPPGGARLLVLNKEDATLVTVDPDTGRILGRAPTGEAPHEVAVSADGRTAVVANYGAQTPGSSLSVIDLTTMTEARRVDVMPLRRPHGVAVHGGAAYFTAETNRVVGRYDIAANKIDWLFGTGQGTSHMLWVNADATAIYTANITGNSISILERGANPLAWTQTVVPVGQGPEGFDVTPDGRQLWAANSRDGSVSIIDLARKQVIATIDVQTRRSNRLKFTPDGKTALISDLDAGTVLVLDVATRQVTKRLPVGAGVAGILVQPDGARAYAAATDDNIVAIIDLRKWAVTGRIEPGRGPDGMAWIQ
jgi:YVTN family beta-propeller protein